MRILVLLDEADNFLDADSNSRFENVEALGNLRATTKGRFKVVFAGLHNVHAFRGSLISRFPT